MNSLCARIINKNKHTLDRFDILYEYNFNSCLSSAQSKAHYNETGKVPKYIPSQKRGGATPGSNPAPGWVPPF